MNLKQFDGSKAKVEFIRLFDRLFDILNSRSVLAKGYKSALTTNNQPVWESFLDFAFAYIRGLRDVSGKNICTIKRKSFLDS